MNIYNNIFLPIVFKDDGIVKDVNTVDVAAIENAKFPRKTSAEVLANSTRLRARQERNACWPTNNMVIIVILIAMKLLTIYFTKVLLLNLSLQTNRDHCRRNSE
jgi:hypothetical protein